MFKVLLSDEKPLLKILNRESGNFKLTYWKWYNAYKDNILLPTYYIVNTHATAYNTESCKTIYTYIYIYIYIYIYKY